jgi:hypothetical protein
MKSLVDCYQLKGATGVWAVPEVRASRSVDLIVLPIIFRIPPTLSLD